jgi:hypothetical protein
MRRGYMQHWLYLIRFRLKRDLRSSSGNIWSRRYNARDSGYTGHARDSGYTGHARDSGYTGHARQRYPANQKHRG